MLPFTPQYTRTVLHYLVIPGDSVQMFISVQEKERFELSMFCLFAHDRFLASSQNSVLNSTISFGLLHCQRVFSSMNSIKHKLRCMRYREKSVTNGYFISFFFYIHMIYTIYTQFLKLMWACPCLFAQSFAYLYCCTLYSIEFCLLALPYCVQYRVLPICTQL